MTAIPLIEIEGLRVVFHGDDGRTTHAVDSVDLSVANGATLGLVGESGCGKSVTSLAIMGLLSKGSAEVSGSIRFDGFDLLDVPDETLRDLRGNRLAMIFQEPMTSLNPSFTIGDQIIETIVRHRGGLRRQARRRGGGLFPRVDTPSPGKRGDEYPHKISRGTRQPRRDPGARPPRLASGHHRGHGAEHDRSTARLPLCRTLSVRARHLHQRAAAARHAESGTRLALHPGSVG